MVFNARYIVDGDIVFKNACALRCEGIVSKRLGSSYRSRQALAQDQESGGAGCKARSGRRLGL
jgi:hypothetical protein